MLPFCAIKTSAELEAIKCTVSCLNSPACFVSLTAAILSNASSSHRTAWIRFIARACVLQSERHVNKMVLWPGLGRREVRLHKSEEATACSSLNCAVRCILFTAPRACILCFLASCRFANCAICSLVAGFTLMVYRYRIIMLRCRWRITPVIRGKISSPISRLCAGTTGIAEILFEQPVHLLRDYHGFYYRDHATIFCVSPGNSRRLDITSTEPIVNTISKIMARTIGDWSV